MIFKTFIKSVAHKKILSDASYLTTQVNYNHYFITKPSSYHFEFGEILEKI